MNITRVCDLNVENEAIDTEKNKEKILMMMPLKTEDTNADTECYLYTIKYIIKFKQKKMW